MSLTLVEFVHTVTSHTFDGDVSEQVNELVTFAGEVHWDPETVTHSWSYSDRNGSIKNKIL